MKHLIEINVPCSELPGNIERQYGMRVDGVKKILRVDKVTGEIVEARVRVTKNSRDYWLCDEMEGGLTKRATLDGRKFDSYIAAEETLMKELRE